MDFKKIDKCMKIATFLTALEIICKEISMTNDIKF